MLLIIVSMLGSAQYMYRGYYNYLIIVVMKCPICMLPLLSVGTYIWHGKFNGKGSLIYLGIIFYIHCDNMVAAFVYLFTTFWSLFQFRSLFGY